MMLTSKSVLLLAVLVGFVPSCKQFKTTSVSHIKGSANPDVSGLVAHGCIEKARLEAINPSAPHSTDAEANSLLADFSKVLDPTAESYVEYQRDVRDQRFVELGSHHYYRVAHRTADVKYSIEIVTPSKAAASAASFLQVSTETRLREGGHLRLILSQSFKIEGRSGCPRTLSRSGVTKFSAGTEGSLRMTSVETNALTGQVISRLDKTLSNELLVSEGKLSEMHNLFADKSGQLTMRTFLSDGLSDVVISFTVKGTSQEKDPVIDRIETMTKADVTIKAGQATLKGVAKKSKGSIYQAYQWDYNPGVTTETISREMFVQTALNTPEETFEPKMIGFKDGSFADPTLSYALGAPKSLSFDNFSAYFRSSKLDPREVPGSAPENYQWMLVENRAGGETPLLKRTFKSAQKDTKYLGQTFYFDYSDPRITALTKKIPITPSATYKEIVERVLDITVSAIKYDHDAVNQSAISLMRASDAVKSGKGVCQHYAAVFVALARSIGLPARVVAGFYLSKSDGEEPDAGPHAWVEVLIDGKYWLPLEPQNKELLYLPGPNYLPVYIMTAYEMNSNDGIDVAGLVAENEAMRGLYLISLPPKK